jgi:hypothetical protein
MAVEKQYNILIFKNNFQSILYTYCCSLYNRFEENRITGTKASGPTIKYMI